MKKGKTNPMARKLKGLLTEKPDASKGVLYNLWSRLLFNAGTKDNQPAPITEAEWMRSLNSWADSKIKEGLDAESINQKRSSLPRVLASDNITWRTFMQGLEILAQNDRFEDIRIEIQLKPKGLPTRVLGVNIAMSPETFELASQARALIEMGVPRLGPGMEIRPKQVYVLDGFLNSDVLFVPMLYRGTVKRIVEMDEFNGYTIQGTMVMDKNGIPVRDWVVSSLKGGEL